jgi:hypothetical protein
VAARLRRRGFWLEYASMAWMVVEAGVTITAAAALVVRKNVVAQHQYL